MLHIFCQKYNPRGVSFQFEKSNQNFTIEKMELQGYKVYALQMNLTATGDATYSTF